MASLHSTMPGHMALAKAAAATDARTVGLARPKEPDRLRISSKYISDFKSAHNFTGPPLKSYVL